MAAATLPIIESPTMPSSATKGRKTSYISEETYYKNFATEKTDLNMNGSMA